MSPSGPLQVRFVSEQEERLIENVRMEEPAIKATEAPLGLVKTLRSVVTDGFILAALTGFAYLATFIYERGYCAHFDIPATLINPNTSTLLVAICALGGTLLASSNLLGFTAPLFRAGGDPERGAFQPIYRYFAIALVVAILVFRIYDFGWKGAIGLGIGVIVGFAIFFGPTLLTNRKKPVAQRLEEDMEIQRNDPFDFGRMLEIWIHQRAVNYLFVFLGFLILSWMTGNGNASTQDRFLTLRDDPGTVVLRTYGDLFITAKFSRETREVSNELSLMWLSDKKQLDFRNEPVGPLALASDKTQPKKTKEMKVTTPPIPVPASAPPGLPPASSASAPR